MQHFLHEKEIKYLHCHRFFIENIEMVLNMKNLILLKILHVAHRTIIKIRSK